ncbi:MAG: amidase [Myxococcota bacterium]
MAIAEYAQLDALDLARLVREGEVTATELVEEAVARIERVNLRLNAVVHPLYQQARAVARRPTGDPFGGVPFLLKDLLQTLHGIPTTAGSRFYRGWVADHDTELVRRYRRAGLIFVGKTNTPELGIVPVTEPELFGPTANPWLPDRTPGGSSGGSAAAVAAGIVPMAHGGDGGGSIRIPASCCGLFGLKPSRGRNPLGPDVSELWSGYVQEHVLSRSVRDSAAALDATCGPEPTSPYHAPPRERPYLEEVGREPGALCIAFHSEPPMGGQVHADCVEALHDAARLCEELGHRVEEVSPQHSPDALAQAYFAVVAAHTAVDLEEASREMGRPAGPDGFESATWLTAQIGRRLSAADLARAQRDLQAESRRLASRYASYDAILTPTLAKPPVHIGELQPHGLEKRVQDLVARRRLHVALDLPGVVQASAHRILSFIPFTPVANFTGQPSMSVPLWWNAQGLPIGTMFTARLGDEATLFRLAAQLERARPWAHRRPALHSGA